MASMYMKNLSNGNKVWTMGFVLTCDYKTHCSHVIIWQKFFEKNFVKWQQSLNNGFCTHMWLQNPLFKLCYHLTSFFVKTKKCHLPFTLELSSFERTFLFYYNVNPVIRKWQHRILLTSSFMLEKFPSHSWLRHSWLGKFSSIHDLVSKILCCHFLITGLVHFLL